MLILTILFLIYCLLPFFLFTDPPGKPNLLMAKVVKENDVHTITCTVESSPMAKLTLSVSPTNQGKARVIKMTVWSDVLNFTSKASVSDAGVYTCAASNTEGENSSTKQLKVLCE